MSVNEIATVERQLRERIASVLSPHQQASYDAYRQRIEDAVQRHNIDPIMPTADEQAALDVIANDTQAAALDKQLRVLLRIETLPQ